MGLHIGEGRDKFAVKVTLVDITQLAALVKRNEWRTGANHHHQIVPTWYILRKMVEKTPLTSNSAGIGENGVEQILWGGWCSSNTGQWVVPQEIEMTMSEAIWSCNINSSPYFSSFSYGRMLLAPFFLFSHFKAIKPKVFYHFLDFFKKSYSSTLQCKRF